MRKAYIVAAKRSAIGTFLGSLTDVDLATVGATVLKETIKQANIDPANLDEVIIGNVIAAGLGQNIARHVAFDAGIPVEVCAQSINMLCGSGLKAVMEATLRIQANFGDLYVAGGVESMTRAPFMLSYKNRTGTKMGDQKLVDAMLHDGLTDAMYGIHMGCTADNIAKKYNISREAQDEFAFASQEKALAAIAAGKFKDEIVPITYKTRKGEVVFDTDEHPKFGTTIEKVAKLKPAFKRDGGTVTAANASGINDGAAAVVVMSEEKAKELGVTPMATWVAGALGGVDPSIMGVGPVASTKKVLAKTGLTIDDFDVYEANEAFAAQSVAVGKDLNFDLSKLNPNGGAIALGHPVGASGCRILVTLLHEMQKMDAKRGLATLCIGGGMGCSTVVERD